MAAPAARSPRSDQSVLVVDDSIVDRKLAEQALSRAGYSVATVAGGDECMSTLAVAVFDAVLLDVNMPGMDGFQLLQAIKSRPHLRTIPIIMMSSDAEEPRIVRSIELGAADFVLKPMAPAVLRARVAAAVQKHPRAPAFWRSVPAPVPATSSLLRILAVDDSVTTLRVLQRSLTKRGYHVTLADSGEAALRILDDVAEALDGESQRDTLAFDVMLLDIIMPGLQGQDVIRRMRAGPACWAGIPIIVMSSLDDPITANECLALGADDVITKPFNADVVVTRINACTERLRLRSWVASKLGSLSSSAVSGPGVSDHGLATSESRTRELADGASIDVDHSATDGRATTATHPRLAVTANPLPSAIAPVPVYALPPRAPVPEDHNGNGPSGSTVLAYESEIDRLLRGHDASVLAPPLHAASVLNDTTAAFQQPTRSVSSGATTDAEQLAWALRRIAELEGDAMRSELATRSQVRRDANCLRDAQGSRSMLCVQQQEHIARLEEQLGDMQQTLRALTHENRQLKKQATTLYDHERQLIGALKVARSRVRRLYEEAAAHGYVPTIFDRVLNHASGSVPNVDAPRQIAVDAHEEALLVKALSLFQHSGALLLEDAGAPQQLTLLVSPLDHGADLSLAFTPRKPVAVQRPLPSGYLFRGSSELMALVVDVLGFPAYFVDFVFDRLVAWDSHVAPPNEVARVSVDAFLRMWVYPQPVGKLPCPAPAHDRVERFWRLARHPLRSAIVAEDLLDLVGSLVNNHADLASVASSAANAVAYQLVVVISLFCSLHGQRNMRISQRELRCSNLVDAFYLVANAGSSRHVVPFSLSYVEDMLAQWRAIAAHAAEAASALVSMPASARRAQIDRLPLWAEDALAMYGCATFTQVAAWAEPQVNPWVLQRIMHGASRPLHCPLPGCVDFVDFIWLFLALRDRMTDSSLFFWFRALDADDDGYLSVDDMRLALAARGSPQVDTLRGATNMRELRTINGADVDVSRTSGRGTPPVALRANTGVIGRHASTEHDALESPPGTRAVHAAPLPLVDNISAPAFADDHHLQPAAVGETAQVVERAHEHHPGSPAPYDPELDSACKPFMSLAVASLQSSLASASLDAPSAAAESAPAVAVALYGGHASFPYAGADIASVPSLDGLHRSQQTTQPMTPPARAPTSAADDVLAAVLDFVSPAVPGRIAPGDIRRSGAGPVVFDVLIALPRP